MKTASTAVLFFAICLIVIALGLATQSNATNNFTKMPLPTEFDPQAAVKPVPDSAPVAEAVSQDQEPAPAKATEATAECTCIDCQCDPCTCGQVTYQNQLVNETYIEMVCDGYSCRPVQRTRQVMRRVAVKAANAARAFAAPVRMQVAGGSSGTYTSAPVVRYDEGVSYGSAGSTSLRTTYYTTATTQGQAWTPVRRVARQPVRNLLRCLSGQ